MGVLEEGLAVAVHDDYGDVFARTSVASAQEGSAKATLSAFLGTNADIGKSHRWRFAAVFGACQVGGRDGYLHWFNMPPGRFTMSHVLLLKEGEVVSEAWGPAQ